VHLTLDEQQSLGIRDTVIPSPKDPVSGACVCVFLDARQEQCTVYYLALDTNCPYAHEHYETQAMRDFIAALVVECETPDFIQRLQKNPWLIQQYDGVLNIAPLSL
jgi:hypothetical protein